MKSFENYQQSHVLALCYYFYTFPRVSRHPKINPHNPTTASARASKTPCYHKSKIQQNSPFGTLKNRTRRLCLISGSLTSLKNAKRRNPKKSPRTSQNSPRTLQDIYAYSLPPRSKTGGGGAPPAGGIQLNPPRCLKLLRRAREPACAYMRFAIVMLA